MKSDLVHKHVDKVNINALVRDGNILKRDIVTNAAPEVKWQLLDIYKTVRPILQYFSGFFLITKKWRVVIKAYMDAMDAITGWEKQK